MAKNLYFGDAFQSSLSRTDKCVAIVFSSAAQALRLSDALQLAARAGTGRISIMTGRAPRRKKDNLQRITVTGR